MLKHKVSSMLEIDWKALRIFYEYSIKVLLDYDGKNGSIIGEASFPYFEGDTTKALAFMLSGVSTIVDRADSFRSSTESLVYKSISKGSFIIILKLIIDISMHWIHCHVSVVRGQTSHKSGMDKSLPFILRFYYGE
ncbi:unnamed protein product [Lepeophtheirus salmonis]|uniref:(salmon louse) hypothetical protein n=1 Tax=Lepeophtheirus salmonis TaxID=72036 RepID=A0A7R8HB54_LEPSM|nr:unnamed protein product [Lepeophtheirus salmonis]CAF2980903.1 unnamed protein product [Lepeophtheirus salmonis]